MVLGVSGVPAMPRPSESTHGIADIGLLAAVLVGLWIGKELVLQVAVVGSLDLLAAGVTLLAIGLGRRVLAPLAAGRSARRRNAHIAALRDRFCAPDNDRFLPMNRPWIAGAGSGSWSSRIPTPRCAAPGSASVMCSPGWPPAWSGRPRATRDATSRCRRWSSSGAGEAGGGRCWPVSRALRCRTAPPGRNARVTR